MASPEVALGWKLYVWIVAAITVVSAVGRVALRPRHPELVSNGSLVESALSLVPVAGLVGLVLGRAFGPQVLWQAVFAAACAYAVAHYAFPSMRAVYRKGAGAAAAVIASELLVGLPALYLLYRYAFGSPYLWHPQLS